MTGSSGPRSAPIKPTQQHAQSLVRFADALAGASVRTWGENVAKADVDQLRDVARRISECSAGSACTFSTRDVELLSQFCEGMVRNAGKTLAQPGITVETKIDAQTQ